MRGDERATRFIDRLPRGELHGKQRFEVRRPRLERSLRDRGGKRQEILLAGDEIRLGVDLDHGHRKAVGRTLDRDHALGGDAARLLVGLGEARLAHRLGGGLEVAVRFDQRLLALHHAGAGALAQCLDGLGSDQRHGQLPSAGAAGAASAAAGAASAVAGVAAGIGAFLRAASRRAMNASGSPRDRPRQAPPPCRARHPHRIRRACDARRRLLAGRGGTALRAGLGARLAFLVELDEFVFAHRDVRDRRAAFEHGVGDAAGVQLDRAHGVVVARDHVADAVGRAVGVDDRDDRDAELAGPRAWRCSRGRRR